MADSNFPIRQAKRMQAFSNRKLAAGGLLALIFALLVIAEPVQAQAVQLNCNQACQNAYSAEGVCLIPGQFTGGLTPYTSAQVCPTGQSCWCKIDPGALCNDRCVREFRYQSGSCAPATTCSPAPNVPTPGYGSVQTNYQIPRSSVSCGLDATQVCCCRNVQDNIYSQAQSFQAAYALVTQKECQYQAAEGVYSVRLSGVWGGGQALRIDIPGAYPVFGQFPGTTPGLGFGVIPGVPPSSLFATGPFFQTFKVPQRLVESRPERIIDARVTVLPTPGQALNNFYRQTLAPNAPLDYGSQVGQNFFIEQVACEGPPIPTPLETLPPAGGAKDIKLLRAECGPKATVYQNEVNLIDFNRESWFQFSASPGSTQSGGGVGTQQFTLGGTGAPGSAPPGHTRGPGQEVQANITLVSPATAGQAAQGSCTFSFSGAQELYGVEITSWDETDNITLKEVQVGPNKFPVMARILSNGTTISYADYNISTPIKSASVKFNFEYTGAPALAELNAFPDVAIVTLNISPTRPIRGSEVTLLGMVTERAFTSDTGRYLYCTYKWDGGCYPCIGRDCKPDPNFPLGKPNWAVFIPLPWVGSTIDTIKDIARNATGFQFLPPVSELSIDVWLTRKESQQASDAKAQLDRLKAEEEKNIEEHNILKNRLNQLGKEDSELHDEILQLETQLEIEAESPETAATLAPLLAEKKARLATVETGFTEAQTRYDTVRQKLYRTYESPVTGFYVRSSAKNIITMTAMVAINVVANLDNEADKLYGIGIGANLLSLLGSVLFETVKIPAGPVDCLAGGLLGCAVRDAIAAGRCTVTGEVIPSGKPDDTDDDLAGWRCPAYFTLITWWHIDSRPEPDPDGAGDYSLTQTTCQEPTEFAQFLFNAGWWSVVQQLGDAVENLQKQAIAAEKAALKAEYEKAGTCQLCVEGVVQGQKYTTVQRNQLTTACNAAFDSQTVGSTQKLCLALNSTSGAPSQRLVGLNATCPASYIEFLEKSQCTSRVEGTATKAPGKWCAKKITISDQSFFTTERSIFVGAKSEASGVCVPLDEACPSGEYETAVTRQACEALTSAADVANTAVDAEFKKITACDACAGKKLTANGVEYTGSWCLKVPTSSVGGKELISFSAIERSCSRACPAGYEPFPPPPAPIPKPPKNYKLTSAGQCAFDQRLLELEKRVINRQATGALEELDQQFIDAAQALSEAGGYPYTCTDCNRDGGTYCVGKNFTDGQHQNAKLICTKFPERDCLEDLKAKAPPTSCSAIQQTLRYVQNGLGADPQLAIQQLQGIKAEAERVLTSSLYRDALNRNPDTKLNLQKLGLEAGAKAIEIHNQINELKSAGGLGGELQKAVQDLQKRYNNIIAGLSLAAATTTPTADAILLCDSIDWTKNNACYTKSPFAIRAVSKGTSCNPGETLQSFDGANPDVRRQACVDFVYVSTRGTFPAVPTALALSPSAPASCIVGSACDRPITVSGGTAPYACLLTPTTVAPGVSCSCTASTCRISGTPISAGVFTYLIGDASTPRKDASFTLNVQAEALSKRVLLITGSKGDCAGWVWAGTIDSDVDTFPKLTLCVHPSLVVDTAEPLIRLSKVSCAGTRAPWLAGILETTGEAWDGAVTGGDDKIYLCTSEQLDKKVLFHVRQKATTTAGFETSRTNYACPAGYSEAARQLIWVESLTNVYGGIDQAWVPCADGVRDIRACKWDTRSESEWFKVGTGFVGVSDTGGSVGLCISDERIIITGRVASELPPGTSVPETPGTASPFGVPATGQLTFDSDIITGDSELFAQEPEPSSLALGQIPATGKLTSSGSFGPIPITGMQIPALGAGATGVTLFQQMIAASGGRLQQLSGSIQIFESLQDGKAVYTRGFTVPPGLSPTCPATDPVFRGKALLSRKFAAPAKDSEIIVSEAYPYWTSEGTRTPVNATVYITIRNSTGDIVKNACRGPLEDLIDCNRVPVNADYQGRTGVYRYIFVPPADDRFDIRVSATGSAGTTTGGSITAAPKPPPGVQVTSPFLCGEPGKEKRFSVTLTEPESSVPFVSYRVSVVPPSGAGILVYDQQGNPQQVSLIDLPMSSGSSSQVVVVSKPNSDEVIKLRIENSTFGFFRELNLTHKISFREQPKLILKNPGSAQSALSEVEYLMELQNNVPLGCDPSEWAIAAEPPTPSGWTIYFNSSQNDISLLSAPGGNATRFPLHATPLTLPSIGRYPIYVLASEFAPEKFKDTGDAVAVAADALNVYYVTDTGVLRIADRLTGNTVERTAGQNPTAVALDDSRVYFAAGGRIATTLKQGSFSPQDVAIGTFAQQIAVDSTDVYWIENNNVKRTTKSTGGADCSGNNCIIIPNVPALDVAVDSNYVYWTERTAVKRALKANPSIVEDAFKGKQNLRGLAHFGGALYATYESQGTGKVVRLAEDGTVEDVLGNVNTETRDYAYAIARNSPTDVAVSLDGTSIYWVEGKAVYAIPLSTLAGLAVAYYQFSPFAPTVAINPTRALASRGDVARFGVNITNRADIPVLFSLNLSPAPPAGWTAGLSPTEAQVSRSGFASAIVEVSSPPNAALNSTYAFCVRALNGTGLQGISGQGCSAYSISPHERPGVTLTILQETPLPAGPGATVGWTAAVRNNDPAEFLSAAPINLSFLVPEGWKAFFLTPEGRQVQSVIMSVPAATANDSVKLFVTSSKSAPDSDYTIIARAVIEGLIGEGTAQYRVVGCGNQVCEPDRGETLRNPDGTPSQLWCQADCAQGFDNFRCTYFKNSSTLGWFECDNTRDNDVQFRTDISVPGAAQLSGTAAIVCKRGSSPEACKAAADAGNCGIAATGFAGALADCAAPLSPVGTGVTGPRYEGVMRCPVDYEGEYYLLFTGTQTTLGAELQPISTQANIISANFSFSCPAYRLQELADKQAQWQTITQGCADRVQQLNGIGQRTCADVVRQTCLLRESLISEMNALLTAPNATRSAGILERIRSVEEFIASRLQVTCFGIPGLQIVGVTPPGTQVGEATFLKVKVNNSFSEDYRGYAACEVELPTGIRNFFPGVCTIFRNFTATDALIPITLTDQGGWQINSCSVYADLLQSIPQERCFDAPLFTSAPADVTFDVQPAEAFLTAPSDGQAVRGTAEARAVVSGFFEGYNLSYSLTSPTCAGGPIIPLSSADSAFTRDYIGSWETSGLPDKEHFVCLMLTVGGRAFAADTARAIVDNHNFVISESSSTRDVRSRETATFNVELTNTGNDDDFVASCDAPPGWTTSISAGGQQASCGQLLPVTLGSGLKIPITVSVTVPDQQSGSALLKVTVTNSQDEALEARYTLSIGGTSNSPPSLGSSSVSPASISSGSSLTFRASLADPEGDSVSSARVCADENCTATRCAMSFGASEWSCSTLVTGDPGTHNWWIEAKDSFGLAAILASARPFTITGELTPVKCESPNTCLSSCKPDEDICINRTDFGRRDCPLGRICCRTEQIPACIPAAGCRVKIDAVKCNWDPVQKNYSVSTQVGWSGGAYVRLTVADLTSDRIFEPTASFAVRTTTPGSQIIAASVLAANDDLLCSNETRVTCNTPGSEPPGSGVAAPKLAIQNAFASSSQPGKGPVNAIDGDQFTPWQSRQGMPQWLGLDLGTSKPVTGVGIYSVSSRPVDFFIDVSQNCVNYINVARVRAATYRNDWNITRFSQRDAKCILLNFTKSDTDTVAVYEAEVYGGAVIVGGEVTAAPELPLVPIVAVIIIALAGAIVFIRRERLRLWWKYVRAG